MLNKTLNAINEVKKVTADLIEPEFIAMICMSLEEYCKDNGCDVIEMVDMIHTTVHAVNDVLGKYGEEEINNGKFVGVRS